MIFFFLMLCSPIKLPCILCRCLQLKCCQQSAKIFLFPEGSRNTVLTFLFTFIHFYSFIFFISHTEFYMHSESFSKIFWFENVCSSWKRACFIFCSVKLMVDHFISLAMLFLNYLLLFDIC